MFQRLITCGIFILFVTDIVLSFPAPHLFDNFNVVKSDTPLHIGFEIKTSLGRPIVFKPLISRSQYNSYDVIPTATGKSDIKNHRTDINKHDTLITNPEQIESKATTITDGFKDKNKSAETGNSTISFNDENSITDVTTEADLLSESTTEFTTIEYYESITVESEDEVLNRSAIPSGVLASLLG